MARTNRSEVFDPTTPGAYHCIQRVVRRAMLCGFDPLTGKSFEHRRGRIENRLKELAASFGIDLLNYAVMSNHCHMTLRNRPDVVATWSDEDVARRWWNLFPKRRNKDKTPAGFPNDVWRWDFVQSSMIGGKTIRFLNIVDEYTRVCLCIKASRSITSEDAIDALAESFAMHGVPKRIRSDNGPEFISSAIKKWLSSLGIEVLSIEPGSPWQNGVCESFKSKLRDEYLSQTELVNENDARLNARAWKYDFNEQRPHSSLGYLTPLEFARRCGASSPLAALAPPNHHNVMATQLPTT